MKKLFYIFLFFSSSLLAQNLVPNPSFEQYDTCPMSSASTTWNGPTGWIINVNSADYYNTCATPSSGVSVPNNGFGYQVPATGNAYCGLYMIGWAGWDVREYLGCPLISPLTIGQKYYVTFKASLPGMWCTVNKLGVLFTNNNYFGNTIFLAHPPPLINNFAYIYTDSLITDTIGWYSIKGSFVADSSYQYLLIGNFFDYANFDSIIYSGSSCMSYYFLDDVCVSTDSLTCNPLLDIIIDEYFKNEINIYPNPANSKVNIRTPFKIRADIKIYNVIGVLIEEFYQTDNEFKIDVSDLTYGTYILKFLYHDSVITKKLTITN